MISESNKIDNKRVDILVARIKDYYYNGFFENFISEVSNDSSLTKNTKTRVTKVILELQQTQHIYLGSTWERLFNEHISLLKTFIETAFDNSDKGLFKEIDITTTSFLGSKISNSSQKLFFVGEMSDFEKSVLSENNRSWERQKYQYCDKDVFLDKDNQKSYDLLFKIITENNILNVSPEFLPPLMEKLTAQKINTVLSKTDKTYSYQKMFDIKNANSFFDKYISALCNETILSQVKNYKFNYFNKNRHFQLDSFFDKSYYHDYLSKNLWFHYIKDLSKESYIRDFIYGDTSLLNSIIDDKSSKLTTRNFKKLNLKVLTDKIEEISNQENIDFSNFSSDVSYLKYCLFLESKSKKASIIKDSVENYKKSFYSKYSQVDSVNFQEEILKLKLPKKIMEQIVFALSSYSYSSNKTSYNFEFTETPKYYGFEITKSSFMKPLGAHISWSDAKKYLNLFRSNKFKFQDTDNNLSFIFKTSHEIDFKPEKFVISIIEFLLENKNDMKKYISSAKEAELIDKFNASIREMELKHRFDKQLAENPEKISISRKKI